MEYLLVQMGGRFEGDFVNGSWVGLNKKSNSEYDTNKETSNVSHVIRRNNLDVIKEKFKKSK